MNLHYAQVALRAGHQCEYCRAPEVVFNFPFEVEHIIPYRRQALILKPIGHYHAGRAIYGKQHTYTV